MLRIPFAAILIASSLGAQAVPQAFLGARVIPITSPPIENGAVVVHEGKIVAVGIASEIQIPEDAERHRFEGKVIMPGFVDTHSHA